MAGQIRITPDALYAAAQRNHTVAETIVETTEHFSALLSQLNAAWDGSASIPVLNAMEDLRSMTKNIADGTFKASDKLREVASAFESCDEGGGFRGVAGILADIGQIILPGFSPFPPMIQDSIRIVPDEVRAVASECKQIAARFANTASELRGMVSELADSWEGRSYDRFAEQTYDLAEGFIRLADATDEYAERISRMATLYEQLDASL